MVMKVTNIYKHEIVDTRAQNSNFMKILFKNMRVISVIICKDQNVCGNVTHELYNCNFKMESGNSLLKCVSCLVRTNNITWFYK